MYQLFKIFEGITYFINTKLKILYWKLKYGKRIKIGKNLKLRKNVIININKGGSLIIGDNNFFNNNCSINCHKRIEIGDNNLFGDAVKLYDHNHVFNDKSVNMKKTFNYGDIKIGNDNWIASNVVILRNTELQNNNVVAAGVVLNGKFDSDNVINIEKKIVTDKIIYK